MRSFCPITLTTSLLGACAVSKPGVGGACARSEQCLDEFAVCERGTCVCQSQYFNQNNRCGTSYTQKHALYWPSWKAKERMCIYIAPFWYARILSKRSDMDHTVLPANNTSNCSLLLIYRPRRDERLSWPGWLIYSGWLTHISQWRIYIAPF